MVPTFYAIAQHFAQKAHLQPHKLISEQAPLVFDVAESRRAVRFFRIGHSLGQLSEIPTPEHNPEFPHTLDLPNMRKIEHLRP